MLNNISVGPRPQNAIQPPPQKKQDQDSSGGVLNTINNASGADGVLQDSSRSASLLYKGSRPGAAGLRMAAALINGDKEDVNKAVHASTAGIGKAFRKINPALEAKAAKAASPGLKVAGKVLKFTGPAAQIIGAPFAAMDVRDAFKAKGSEKNAAIANATFSVIGTVAGLTGIFTVGSPIALPLLIASSTTGGFQLLDNFVLKGKGMDFLGKHVVAPIRQGLRQI